MTENNAALRCIMGYIDSDKQQGAKVTRCTLVASDIADMARKGTGSSRLSLLTRGQTCAAMRIVQEEIFRTV
jgi:hypothetical protein